MVVVFLNKLQVEVQELESETVFPLLGLGVAREEGPWISLLGFEGKKGSLQWRFLDAWTKPAQSLPFFF